MHCHHCSQSLPIGQARLTEQEIESLPMTGYWDVIKWQCVKGAAMYFDVSDWRQKIDTSVTYQENIELLSKKGTYYAKIQTRTG